MEEHGKIILVYKGRRKNLLETFDITPYRIVYKDNPVAFAVIRVQFDAFGNTKTAKVLYANPALERLADCEEGKINGRDLQSLFCDPYSDWLFECMNTIKQGKPYKHVFYDERLKKHLSALFYRIQYGCIGICIQDVSKIIEAEKHEEEAQKRKQDVLNAMGHELRTPFDAIIGFTALAAKSTSFEEMKEHLKMVQSSVEEMRTILRHCLDMNSIGNGQMKLYLEPAAYEDLMCGIRPHLLQKAAKKNQTILFQQSAVNQMSIFIDVLHMQQVLMNLISNAIRFSPEGSTIECITEALIPVDGYLPVHFIVRDHGIGMSPEFVNNKLFHEFEQESLGIDGERGTGLGLYITNHIVELMNGTITCKSTPGAGSEFTVSLLCRIAQEHIDTQEQKEADSFAGKRILICEDHQINAMLVENMLDQKQICHEWAKDGEEGISMYGNHDTGYYDAVIMDLRMPRKNGAEAAREIRASGRPDSVIPIIAMTASAFPEDLKLCSEAGMNEYLAKPIEPEQLYAILSRVF